jgi:hypothetical protein
VDRLSRYNKPISLSLKKNIIKQIRDINEHLVRLTNLTSLEFENICGATIFQDDEHEWLALATSLTNLHTLRNLDPSYDIPIQPLLHFHKLTQLLVFGKVQADSLAQNLRNFSQLVHLHLSVSNSLEESDINFFQSYHTKLTNFLVSISQLAPNTAEKWFESISNLKALYMDIEEPGGRISLKKLTALEHLTWGSDCDKLELSTSNLTFLQLYNK